MLMVFGGNIIDVAAINFHNHDVVQGPVQFFVQNVGPILQA